MSEDIKTLVSEMGSAFEEFKKSYDEKLDKMAKGQEDSALDAKLAAIEAKMDSYEDINQRMVQSQQSKLTKAYQPLTLIAEKELRD